MISGIHWTTSVSATSSTYTTDHRSPRRNVTALVNSCTVWLTVPSDHQNLPHRQLTGKAPNSPLPGENNSDKGNKTDCLNSANFNC